VSCSVKLTCVSVLLRYQMWTESRYRPAVMVLVYQNTMQSIRFRQRAASTH
jgi:hypothetical protein